MDVVSKSTIGISISFVIVRRVDKESRGIDFLGLVDFYFSGPIQPEPRFEAFFIAINSRLLC